MRLFLVSIFLKIRPTERQISSSPFPILLDEDGVVAAYYGVRGIPATYFIDRAGYLYAAAMGARDWAGVDAVQLIKHLLNRFRYH